MSFISSAVVALEKELEYYKQQTEEARAVIAQLHRGYALPGEVTYIHPADYAEVLDKLTKSDTFFLNYPLYADRIDFTVNTVKGTRYKQSVWMPKITKNFE